MLMIKHFLELEYYDDTCILITGYRIEEIHHAEIQVETYTTSQAQKL